jgi:hypothetical protein
LVIGVGIVITHDRRVAGGSRPPVASVTPPLDPDNILTSRIVLSNNWWTDLIDLSVTSFFEHVTDSRHNESAKEIGIRYTPNTKVLDAGATVPVPFSGLAKFTGVALYADIGLIVTYHPRYWPFKKRKAFRFKTIKQSNGQLRLEQLPPNTLLEDYDEAVEMLRKQRISLPMLD